MKQLKVSLLIGALVMSSIPHAFAIEGIKESTFYVNNSKDITLSIFDRDGSKEKPFQNLTTAFIKIEEGLYDENSVVNIKVAAGEYNTNTGEDFPIEIGGYDATVGKIFITGGYNDDFSEKTSEKTKIDTTDADGYGIEIRNVGGSFENFHVSTTNPQNSFYGGGIRANIATSSLDNVNFTIKDVIVENASANFGAGIHSTGKKIGSRVVIDSTVVKDNIAKTAGAGILANGYTTIKNSVIENNSASSDTKGSAGGVYLSGRSNILEGNIIRNNESYRKGPAVTAESTGSFSLRKNRITNNKTKSKEYVTGVVHLENQGSSYLINNIIDNNENTGVYVKNENTHFLNNTIVANQGNAVTVDSNLVHFRNNIFAYNEKYGIEEINSINFETPTKNNIFYKNTTGAHLEGLNITKYEMKKDSQGNRGIIPELKGEGTFKEVEDFMPTATSATIDQGIKDELVKDDFNGNERGLQLDIGAFEYQGPSSAKEEEKEEPKEEEPKEEAKEEEKKEEPKEEEPKQVSSEKCAGFNDITTDSNLCNAIKYAKENGIFEGYPDGSFKADKIINRAEVAKVILAGFDYKIMKAPATSEFKDVDSNAWYAAYLATAKAYGIVGGYPDKTFKPGNTVNRVELLKMFFNTAETDLSEVNASQSPFPDVPVNGGTEWFRKYVIFAKDNKLVDADSSGKFNPTQGMTRGDVAELFYRYRNLR